jgi:crossover junction endodeoxyribonuclease RuvC
MSVSRSQVILGLDPGLRDTGFGAIEVTPGQERLITCGSFQTKRTDDLSARLASLDDQCTTLLTKTHPDLVVIEQLFFSKNVKTAMAVSHARGVLLLATYRKKTPLIELSPLQLKQGITGYGRADKKQIQMMIKMILKLPAVPKPDDAADALALAICGAPIARLRLPFSSHP